MRVKLFSNQRSDLYRDRGPRACAAIRPEYFSQSVSSSLRPDHVVAAAMAGEDLPKSRSFLPVSSQNVFPMERKVACHFAIYSARWHSSSLHCYLTRAERIRMRRRLREKLRV